MLLNLPCNWFFPSIQLFYWTSMIAVAIAAVFVPEIRKWHRYGKLRSGSDNTDDDAAAKKEENASWSSRLDAITVPKRWFLYFYVLGLAWTALLLVTDGAIARVPLELIVCAEGSLEETLFTGFSPVPMGFYLFHTARRLLEEWIIPASNSRMHLAGFLVGASFYGFIPVALTAAIPSTNNDVNPLLFAVGMGVFLVGTKHQTACHRILRELRSSSPDGKYGFPRGDWFELSSSPHYFAEILIYIGLCLICKSVGTLPLDMTLGTLFTSLNLCVTGARTHDWYVTKFGDTYVKEQRWKVIPFLF